MTREERVESLVDFLKHEKEGYKAVQEPVNYEGKRRLLRSLMNVRWPGRRQRDFLRCRTSCCGMS